MQINKRLLCQAQELALEAARLRSGDVLRSSVVWRSAMEILKRSYGR
ncbi:hypothetical protein KKJ13_19990 [Xenorhabdus bovienii]|nr:hypothetical protein [Xenorhabdus bovienii]MDE9443813.1 hypothetical protein [Xenorhabdus bovienii]